MVGQIFVIKYNMSSENVAYINPPKKRKLVVKKGIALPTQQHFAVFSCSNF